MCPVEAITEDLAATGDEVAVVEDNRRFFVDVLAGRGEAIGGPGGAVDVGRIRADTALVDAHPGRPPEVVVSIDSVIDRNPPPGARGPRRPR